MQQTFQCNRCGAQNYTGQSACWNCQVKFPFYCPNCKVPVQNTMVSCPNCRIVLPWPKGQSSQTPSYQNPDNENRGKNPWSIGILVAVFIIIIGGGIVFAANNVSNSNQSLGNQTASTQPPSNTKPVASDTIPPTISGINSSNVAQSSVTIVWTTSEPATSQVEYGTTASYGSITSLDNNLVTSHSVSLNGLAANTTFHFIAKSKDASGNEATDSNRTFMTLATNTTPPVTPPTPPTPPVTPSVTPPVMPTDSTPPIITGVSPTSLTETSAIIIWTTSEPATSQIDYGLTKPYSSTTPLDQNLVTSHSITLSGLSTSSTYHFSVKSRDNSGHEALSSDNILSTTAATEVGGILSKSTTWTEQNGPYVIKSTIQVPEGVSLTIEPGVSVTMSGTTDYMFLVHGNLYALGTTDKRITLDGGTHSFFSSYNASSTANASIELDYCTIKNGTSLINHVHTFSLKHSEVTNLTNYSDISNVPHAVIYIEYNRFTNSCGFRTGGGRYGVFFKYNLFNTKNQACNYPWVCNVGTPRTDLYFNSFINVDGIALMLQDGSNRDRMVATNNYWVTQDTRSLSE